MRRIAAPRAGWSDFAVETVVVQGKIDFKHWIIALSELTHLFEKHVH